MPTFRPCWRGGGGGGGGGGGVGGGGGKRSIAFSVQWFTLPAKEYPRVARRGSWRVANRQNQLGRFRSAPACSCRPGRDVRARAR